MSLKIPEKYFTVKKTIGQLQSEIQNAIDKICEEHNYTISYAEINSALMNILKSNNSEEIKELIKN